MRHILKTTLLVAALAFAGGPASAGLVVLDFEGVLADYPTPYGEIADIGDFYNGGTSSVGTSGVNYGVTFSSETIAGCLNIADIICSAASHGGLGNPASQYTALSALSDTSLTMNVANGFNIHFSLNYTSPYVLLQLQIYDGLDGTGQLLGYADLGVTAVDCGDEYTADYCPFYSAQVAFSGLAKSAVISGYVGLAAFDDISFYAQDSTDVPEPLTLSLIGAGLLGMGAMRRRTRK